MPEAGRAGDWVEVEFVLLAPGERAPTLPDDTAQVPLTARVKGWLEGKAAVGERATVTTLAGRRVEGRLRAVRPAPGHSFGAPQPELLAIGGELRAYLGGAGD